MFFRTHEGIVIQTKAIVVINPAHNPDLFELFLAGISHRVTISANDYVEILKIIEKEEGLR